MPVVEGRVPHEVHRGGGLAQAGAAGDDDELAGLEARQEPVEVGEAGGHAGQDALVGADRLDLVHGRLEEVGQDREVLALAFVGDVVDGLLGEVDQVVDVAAALAAAVAVLDDLGAGLDEAAQDRLVLDDAGVVAGVRGGGDRVEEVVQVGAAADLAEVAGVGERGGDGDRVGGLAVPELVEDGVEDDAVAGLVEVARLEGLEDVGDGVLAHEHAAEDRLLGREVLRRGALVGAGAAEGVVLRRVVEVRTGGSRPVRTSRVAAFG